MLVFSALSPPVTTMSPLPSIEMPGQNMSWFVLVTVAALTWPVFGFSVAVLVCAEKPAENVSLA
jgi:hypothetical protein